VRTGTSHGTSGAAASARGFTLIEVMVALVIVAFGMGAVLATLSSAANNIAALHDKTLAQWIALNLVADTRLNLQLPTAGTTEGDIKAFGNGDWHWQRDIVPVPSIPGLLEITVRVRRTGSSSASDRSSSSSSSSSSSGASRSSGATTFSGSSSFGSSGGAGRLGLSSSSGSTLGAVTNSISTFASSSKDQNWLATIIGFRGDAVAAASGEAPDWTGTSLNGTSSSSSGASSSGAVLNPGSSSGGGLLGSSSGAGSPGPTAPNTGSSGGG
jgi:general secretion pathway protein I